jgi:hypothetical protein
MAAESAALEDLKSHIPRAQILNPMAPDIIYV